MSCFSARTHPSAGKSSSTTIKFTWTFSSVSKYWSEFRSCSCPLCIVLTLEPRLNIIATCCHGRNKRQFRGYHTKNKCSARKWHVLSVLSVHWPEGLHGLNQPLGARKYYHAMCLEGRKLEIFSEQ